MKDKLIKKNKSLKLAIERYDMYKNFVQLYKKTKSLDEYVTHVRSAYTGLSEETTQKYEFMIYWYNHGNPEPLLSNLYGKLLAADEYKTKTANELKSLLKEL